MFSHYLFFLIHDYNNLYLAKIIYYICWIVTVSAYFSLFTVFSLHALISGERKWNFHWNSVCRAERHTRFAHTRIRSMQCKLRVVCHGITVTGAIYILYSLGRLTKYNKKKLSKKHEKEKQHIDSQSEIFHTHTHSIYHLKRRTNGKENEKIKKKECVCAPRYV